MTDYLSCPDNQTKTICFTNSFRFELTKEEVGEVVANCDHLQSLKFRPTLPYAFTEQGIGQLSTVVRARALTSSRTRCATVDAISSRLLLPSFRHSLSCDNRSV